MSHFTDYLFHADQWLRQTAAIHVLAVYVLIFTVVFAESAFFPLAPFLPGDGLLFGVGILAAEQSFSLLPVLLFLIAGGVLGNWAGYRLGMALGNPMSKRFPRFYKKDFEKAHAFFQEHGANAFLISRFVPVVRALAPFVSGVVKMDRRDFWKYNFVSVIIWVCSITLVAYFLGHLPFVKDHFALIMLCMMTVSMAVLVTVWVKGWRAER